MRNRNTPPRHFTRPDFLLDLVRRVGLDVVQERRGNDDVVIKSFLEGAQAFDQARLEGLPGGQLHGLRIALQERLDAALVPIAALAWAAPPEGDGLINCACFGAVPCAVCKGKAYVEPARRLECRGFVFVQACHRPAGEYLQRNIPAWVDQDVNPTPVDKGVRPSRVTVVTAPSTTAARAPVHEPDERGEAR